MQMVCSYYALFTNHLLALSVLLGKVNALSLKNQHVSITTVSEGMNIQH